MSKIEWKKIKLDDGAYESSAIFDVNGDGILDIVCGEYWYEGPNWKKHKLCDIGMFGEFYDDFCSIPLDVNGDGYIDIVSGGWLRKALIWRENPKGKLDEWKTHLIHDCGSVESAGAWDVDGDGEIEIVPNTPYEPLYFYKLIKDRDGKGTGKFEKHLISSDPPGHGLGFGIINGKRAIVAYNGWWESPDDPLNEPWIFHQEFNLGSASVPIILEDFNNDGFAEIIVGQAHGYGLDYYQQVIDGEKRSWVKHPIDPYFSQYHHIKWVDIDNDGECELLAGNRYRAHSGKDAGETETVGLYCFKWNGESFTKQVIDHGQVPHASGAGLYLSVADLTGNGFLDIVAPGKEGLYLFTNLGFESEK